nr:hypothetical protein [uncultured bacterium]
MDSGVLTGLPFADDHEENRNEHFPTVAFDLGNLPVDVFDVVDSGLTVESLTAGHGMAENGASCAVGCSGCSGTTWDCCCSCGTD